MYFVACNKLLFSSIYYVSYRIESYLYALYIVFMGTGSIARQTLTTGRGGPKPHYICDALLRNNNNNN